MKEFVVRARGFYACGKRGDCPLMFSYCSAATEVCDCSAFLFLLGNTVSSSVSMSTKCDVEGLSCEVRVAPVTLSGDYTAIFSGATGWNLGFPGSSANGDFDWSRSSPVLAAGISLSEFPWINLSIISVKAEIWSWISSRLAFILFSNKTGENLALASSFRSFVSISNSAAVSSLWADLSGRANEV